MNATFLAVALTTISVDALAQQTNDQQALTAPVERDQPTPRFAPLDPTGGAYTAPTLLFIPAASVPKWNARAILSTEIQSPADVDAVVRPGIGVEVGLPARITLGAGTSWVGGDVSTEGQTDFNLGISPYFQARIQLYGDNSGKGFLLGTGLTYKFVGFEGDPGEMELSLSAEYRARYFELGLQGVIGQDFADPDGHDAEIHAFALARPTPRLALGVAGQVRIAIAPPEDSDESTYDVVGGGLVSFTIDRYQFATLGGVSTIGLEQGTVGGLAQVFVSARF